MNALGKKYCKLQHSQVRSWNQTESEKIETYKPEDSPVQERLMRLGIEVKLYEPTTHEEHVSIAMATLYEHKLKMALNRQMREIQITLCRKTGIHKAIQALTKEWLGVNNVVGIYDEEIDGELVIVMQLTEKKPNVSYPDSHDSFRIVKRIGKEFSLEQR